MFLNVPKAVPFVLCSILLERYTSGGMAGKVFHSVFSRSRENLKDY